MKTTWVNIAAKVIAASRANGKTIWSVQLKYPRFIHSELLTHRMLSKSSSSSRAIPVKRMLAQVWNEPAHPVHWGMNQPGMQAKAQLVGCKLWVAQKIWKTAAKAACCFVYILDKVGLHKQVANRILEPWQYMHVIVTGTEWDNFFELRDHEDAQPEFRALAVELRKAMATYRATDRDVVTWLDPVFSLHLPYVTNEERHSGMEPKTLMAISAARCARVSYLTHDGDKPSTAKDLALFDRLVGSKPEHASPLEHPASPETADEVSKTGRHNPYYNLRGWTSFRWIRDHATPAQ
jgi:thymidylate synthase ThyX